MVKGKMPLLFFLLALLSSCKTNEVKEYLFGKHDPNHIQPTDTYHIYVNAINDGIEYKDKLYYLVPGLKDISEGRLQYKEYASYIHRAMEKAGYKRAESPDEADMGVLFAFGIGEPEKVTTYKTVSYTSKSPSYTTISPSYYNYATATTAGGSGLGVSSTKANTTVTYTRVIILDAYDFKHLRKSGEEKQLWLTKAVSTGSKGDLREVLPVMVTSIVPYIGSDTEKILKLVVKAPSKELYEIMGKQLPSSN